MLDFFYTAADILFTTGLMIGLGVGAFFGAIVAGFMGSAWRRFWFLRRRRRRALGNNANTVTPETGRGDR